jgi:pimeloyl-ACP methyl ester carboxylesterase
MQTHEHWIEIAPARLFARSWLPAQERGSPIVLLHDSLGSVELWRDFPSQLCGATQRRVIAYDRWGFGRSDPREGRMPHSFILDEGPLVVPALCEQLGIDQFVAFGHSVGGGMAIACAAAMPERVAAVITVAAQSYVEQRTRDGILAAKADFDDPKNFARLERYHGAKARWVLDAWTQTWLSTGFADWTLDAQLQKVHCPLLAIHGDRDEYGSTDHPQHIGKLAAGKTSVVILPDCGHLPHRERAAQVIEAVRAFLTPLS